MSYELSSAVWTRHNSTAASSWLELRQAVLTIIVHSRCHDHGLRRVPSRPGHTWLLNAPTTTSRDPPTTRDDVCRTVSGGGWRSEPRRGHRSRPNNRPTHRGQSRHRHSRYAVTRSVSEKYTAQGKVRTLNRSGEKSNRPPFIHSMLIL